ncbi:MAG: PAS domain S-box protein [Ignavibacteria bacterium]|nr:PAS domain S-box protein [Ignavibacteria bacterium]
MQKENEDIVKRIKVLQKENNNLNKKLKDQAAAGLGNEITSFWEMFIDSPAVMMLIDPSTRKIIDANQAAEQFYGYTRTEFKEKLFISDINILSLSEIAEEMKKTMANKKNTFHFKHKTAGGSIKDVEVLSNKIILEGKEFLFSVVQDVTEKLKSQKELEASEEKYRSLVDSSPAGIYIYKLEKDDKLIFKFGNASADKMYNIKHSKLVGLPIEEAFPNLAYTPIPEMYRKIAKGELGIQSFEIPYRDERFEGHYKVYAFQTNPGYTAVNFLDISEQKKAELEIIRMNRLYAVISQVNQAVVRINDQTSLFRELCNITVKFGKFRMAWIGLFNKSDSTISAKYWSGYEEGFLKKTEKNYSVVKNETFNPVTEAFLTGKICQCNDIANIAFTPKWKEEALSRGYRSLISLPIKTEGSTFGVFSIYSAETHFFKGLELNLLEEISGDINFALTSLNQKKLLNQTLEKLKEHEFILSKAISLSNIGIFYVYPENNKVVWSPELYKIFGIKEDVTPTPELYYSIVHPDDYLKTKEFHDRILGTKNKYSEQEIRILKNGSEIRYILESSTYIEEADSSNTRIIGAIQDITERRLFEKRIKESEEKFRYLFDTMAQGVVIQDRNSDIIEANKAAANILGVSMDMLLGKSAYDPRWKLVHEDGSTMYPEEMPSNVALRTGKSVNNFYCGVYIPEINDYHWIIINSVPRFEEGDSRPVSTFTTFTDVTEQKKDKERIQKSEASLSALIESVDSPIWSIDKNYKFITFNNFIKKNYKDYTSHDLNSRISALDSMNESLAKFWKEKYNIALAGEKHSFELCLNKTTLDIYLNPIISEGEIIGVAAIGIDISEEKAAKQAAEERDYWLKESQKIGNVGSYILDIRSGIWDSSETLDNIFGIERSEKKSVELWFDIIHPEYRNEMMDYFTNYVVSGKNTFDKEYRIIRKNDNAERWVYGRGEVTLDENKEPIKMIGTIQDITKRKRVELALKESEEIFNLFMYYSPVYMFFKDSKIRSLRLSKNFEKMLGKPLEELVGKTMDDLFPSELAKSMIEDDKKVLLEGKVVSVDEEFNGHYYTTVKFPIFINNKPQYLAGFTIDLTEKKLAEKAYRESEEKFRTLFLSMNEGVSLHKLITDNKGNPVDYQIVDVNPAFEKQTGLLATDAKNKLASEFYKINPPPFLEYFAAVALSGIPSNFEEYFEPIGKYFDISVFSPSPGFFATVFADITEKKKYLAEILAAKESAESMNKAKSTFLATMSHELRTPLVGILGYSEMLNSEIEDPLHKEMAQGIQRTGKRLLNTLSLVLDLSRIESNRFEINIQKTDIIPLIKEIYLNFEGAAVVKNINLILNISQEILVLNTDEAMLKVILENLIGNAIKFTKTGSVKINVGAETSKKENFCAISVEDTGIGIKEEDLKYIFEEFRQVSEGTTREFPGTGLGLTIAKKYIELLNGQIEVKSKYGKGSIFKLLLKI